MSERLMPTSTENKPVFFWCACELLGKCLQPLAQAHAWIPQKLPRTSQCGCWRKFLAHHVHHRTWHPLGLINMFICWVWAATPPQMFHGLCFQGQISLGICRRVQVLVVFMENRPRKVTVTCISFLYLPATRRERFNLLL